MKMGGIFKTTVLSLSTIAATSCERGPLHKISEPNQIVRTMDSLAEVTKKTLANKNYHLFGADTIEISQDISKKSDNFVSKINSLAQSNSPEEITGSYITLLPVSNGRTTTLIPQTNFIYTDKFVNSRAVIGEGVFANKSGEKLFVPVKYYGEVNPELSPQ